MKIIIPVEYTIKRYLWLIDTVERYLARFNLSVISLHKQPILVIKNEDGKDLFHRPEIAKMLRVVLAEDFPEVKIENE